MSSAKGKRYSFSVPPSIQLGIMKNRISWPVRWRLSKNARLRVRPMSASVKVFAVLNFHLQPDHKTKVTSKGDSGCMHHCMYVLGQFWRSSLWFFFPNFVSDLSRLPSAIRGDWRRLTSLLHSQTATEKSRIREGVTKNEKSWYSQRIFYAKTGYKGR